MIKQPVRDENRLTEEETIGFLPRTADGDKSMALNCTATVVAWKQNVAETRSLRRESLNSNKIHSGSRRRRRLLAGSLIVACAHLAHFLTCGVSFSIGVYYVTFLEAFGESNGLTAWIGSLNFGFVCAAGPLASQLIARQGCSVTILFGGLLASMGLLGSAYAVNLYMVFVTYGIVCGVGFGLVFSACLVVITQEFDEYRTVALGTSMAGVGLGTVVQPVLASYLIDHYGWRGALMITSALTLHTCALALIIRCAQNVNKANRDDVLASTSNDVNANDKKQCDVSMEIASYDVTLLEEKSIWSLKYMILHLNLILYCFGQSVIYTHIVAYAHNKGHAMQLCSYFISLIGVSNVIGRILLGIVAQAKSVNITVLYAFCYITAGICCYGYCIWDAYITMATMMTIIGFMLAAFGPLLSEIVCVTVGVDKFPIAYGYLLISMAFGTLLGAPSAGWLFDVTSVYEYSFILGGSTLILSGVLMFVPMLKEIADNIFQ